MIVGRVIFHFVLYDVMSKGKHFLRHVYNCCTFGWCYL